MRKIVAKIILAILLVFLGTAGVSASYTAVPIRQYTANGFYSDWYLQYRNELSKEYNGKLYGSEYLKHFALWLRVEGFTEKQVNKNPNKILTIPVSGKLAENADKYVVLSDNGESVPTTVTIGEKTFAKSAEKLYTVVQEQNVTQPAVVAVTAKITEKAITPSPTVKQDVASKNSYKLVDVIILVLGVVLVSLIVGKKEKKEVVEKKTEIEFKIREEDAVLLDAIQKAGNLTVRDGNTIHLLLMEDGKVAIPGNIPVNNKPKNIRAGLFQAYAKKNK